MLKRTLSLVLCLLMVLGLTACSITTGGEDGSEYYVESFITETVSKEDTDTDKDASSKKDTTSKKDTSSKVTQPGNVVDNKETAGRFDVDYSGKTVKLLLWYTPEPWEKQIYDEYEKQTGAKIKYIPVADATLMFQKLTALIAANDAPDATMFDANNYFPSFITKRLAQPLTKYIDKSKDTWLAYNLMDACKYNGEYYGITDHFWGGTKFVYFNKKIFGSSTKVKKTPLDYYNEGKWTWDAFYELAEALTVKDKSGNVTQWGAKYDGYGAFSLSAGASVIKPNNGNFTNTINSKEMKDSYEFVKKLNKNNYMTKDQGSWTGGNIAMYVYDQYPVRVDKYESWKNAKFEWDWVPFPSYTGGTSYQPIGVQLGIVPRKAKNPELGYSLVNWRAYYQANMKAISQSNKAWVERWKKAVTGKTYFSVEPDIIGNQVWTLYAELSDPSKSLENSIKSWTTVVDGAIRDYEKEKKSFSFK